jgi:DNA replication regulator SLD3
MLLPREHLPLAYIDFAASNGDLPQSRFYESYIHVLDLESRLGPAPVVLIARNELRGTTYALERQSNGLYVICKLGSWADLESLAQKATAVRYEQLNPVKSERTEHHGVDALTTPHLHVEQKKKRAAIEAIQSQMRKRVRSQSVSTVGHATKEEQPPEPETVVAQQPSPDMSLEQVPLPTSEDKNQAAAFSQGAVVGGELEPQQSADDIFEGIRTQYFDALYKSMVRYVDTVLNSHTLSLAHVATGILSVLCQRTIV